MQKTVYDIIKRQNGERFAKVVRNYDNGILDIPNIAHIVKYAGRNAEPIMSYLQSLKNVHIEDAVVTETPFELLHRAGYASEYADTLEKQNAIEKYFAPREKLCTFDDPTRYQEYYIINAVRYNVMDIRRMDFPNPRREDDYGTSVMSIQIAKRGGFISIKNRYNHTVENSDNTYNSNPDSIISGLAASIKQYFNVDFASHKIDLPDGYVKFDDQIIKYNFERQNVYFGDGFFVKNHKVCEINRDCEIMMDYHIFNLHTRAFRRIIKNLDGFPDVFQAEVENRPLQVKVHRNERGIVCREIMANNMTLVRTENNMITYVNFPRTQNIPDFFLRNNITLREIHLPNARNIGVGFVAKCARTDVLDAPNIETIDDDFMVYNCALSELNMPCLMNVGARFLARNTAINKIDFPNLQQVGADFFIQNGAISSVNMPALHRVGANFMQFNNALTYVCFPQLQYAGEGFMSENNMLESLDVPKLIDVGEFFLFNNNIINRINAPMLPCAGSTFLAGATALTDVNMPKLPHRVDNGRMVLNAVPWGCLMGRGTR